jgi:methionyl-tRNA synthetase
MISIDDVSKLDIRIGTIKSVDKISGADRLLVLMVDVGEDKDRQIVSGIAEYYEDLDVLIGRQVPVIVNLEEKTIRGVESHGMILYVVGDKFLNTLEPSEKNISAGTQIK